MSDKGNGGVDVILPCPFCGEHLDYREFNDAHFHRPLSGCVIGDVIIWKERRQRWNKRAIAQCRSARVGGEKVG